MQKKSILRVIILVLISALLLSMAACGKTGDDKSQETSDKSQETSDTSQAEIQEPASFGWTKTLSLAETGVVKETAPALTGDASQLKIGVILVGDETEGYTKAHIDGIKDAADELGLSESQIIWKYSVAENEDVVTAADQLYAEGCRLIISNSYGHQEYMLEAATKHSDAHFIALTGDNAAANVAANVVSNFSNAFTDVYESRYVSGVVAGLKLKALVDDGTLTKEKLPDSFDADGNIKIGYVGAFNYAEVMSGFTAFFLGIKSVVSNVSMEVYYTSSWFDFDKEKSAAETFINRGCVIIGQHADSAGAPTAVETAYDAGKLVFSVGYNVSMLDAAEDAALTSATNVWGVYYKYAFATFINGGDIAVNWSAGYNDGAVEITELGASCAEGTAAYVEDIINQIKAGTLHVFDTSKFTYKGKNLTWAYATDSDGNYVYDMNNVIADGYYHESHVQSAPAFNILIDGISELNTPGN
ncbi:MAG: BMP family ABC transporter substrate-binding protein [Eubacteriales bacterium]|nr:BMP family ABC transporter substrate-binding protein [Eubacteriales bacterium]